MQAAPQVPGSNLPASGGPAGFGGPGAANPWQTAFQALSQSLNTSSPSQAPAQYSAYQTPTPQAMQPANWGSMDPTAAPTYSPQASTQGYSDSPRWNRLVDRAIQHGADNAADAYLSQVSDESLEVLQHFGAEAPYLLNHIRLCCRRCTD